MPKCRSAYSYTDHLKYFVDSARC
eukprot:SAG22_NODE_3706_length_1565_cov_1.381310_1_plen_23_part_10